MKKTLLSILTIAGIFALASNAMAAKPKRCTVADCSETCGGNFKVMSATGTYPNCTCNCGDRDKSASICTNCNYSLQINNSETENNGTTTINKTPAVKANTISVVAGTK